MRALSVKKGLPHLQKLETVTLTCSAVRPKRLAPLIWAPAPRRRLTCAASPFAAAAVSSSSSGIVQNLRPRAAVTGTPAGMSGLRNKHGSKKKKKTRAGRETKINK